MNPYTNGYAPPLSSDESYFNYALGSHLRFAFIVLLVLVVLLILLWNSQPWFEIKIERANRLPQETTQGTDGQNLNLALQSNIEWNDYRVRPGETLSEIAERYGVGLSDLRKHNGIDNPNAIRSGQRLKIPQRRNH
jgi:hypothetical protein